MLLSLIILAVIYTSASATCSVPWPNGTDEREHWWSCPGLNPIYNVTPTDLQGNHEYPLHLYLPFYVRIDVDNIDHNYPTGTLRDDVNIWSWGGNLDCRWQPVPTLGLLSNQDSCDEGLTCPILMGRRWRLIYINFTLYQAILDVLKDDAPYQLQYVLKDHANADRVIACVFMQGRCRMHP